jgi:hypothetical protein
LSCSTCYEALLKACPPSIELKAGLTANTEYFWVLRPLRTGKIYQRKASTNVDAKLVIDTTVLPDGLLNNQAGAFSLEIREGNDYLQVKQLTINTVAYNCIVISFVDIGGDPGINNTIYSA